MDAYNSIVADVMATVASVSVGSIAEGKAFGCAGSAWDEMAQSGRQWCWKASDDEKERLSQQHPQPTSYEHRIFTTAMSTVLNGSYEQ
ncbi:hypothetical protein O1611_g8678 [Lasiodiplodia mahajangana]|uniref:Uncharacterized protein n=1 Tax=Lasiodiplodia mahajangana TaxID=1108764 RepID=A0ACC2JCE0_9PEZI|nr:hypothetical protein O1611_g8678 [Lasiodiplodia mahajangana]